VPYFTFLSFFSLFPHPIHVNRWSFDLNCHLFRIPALNQYILINFNKILYGFDLICLKLLSVNYSGLLQPFGQATS